MKRSRIISLRRIAVTVVSVFKTLKRDRINVYAAESAFYIILSAVPFLIMIVTLARYVLPENTTDYIKWLADHIPGVLGEYVKTEFFSSMETAATAPLSLSAIGTLWSASRGIKAVRRGVRSVFGEDGGSFFGEVVSGLIFTSIFIILIIALLVFLVFGDALSAVLGAAVPSLRSLFDLIVIFSPVFFSFLLVMFFAFMLRALTPNTAGMEKYGDHLPGAVLAAIGWIMYSYLFSLFIDRFSDMSHIYGSLAAIMILMLWIYIIMYILLLGAEFNKYLFSKEHERDKHIL